jgi:LemA protein
MKKETPEFQPGDTAVMHSCPNWSSCSGHRAKILGYPAPTYDGKWLVPIRFWCDGVHKANYPCGQLIKTRSSMKLSKPAITTLVVLAILFIGGMWCAGNFNSLVDMNEDVDNAWAKVETQYQRRFDLVGNLVESVKGSQLQEQKVFKDIADARRQYQSAGESQNSEGQAEAASRIETNVALIPRLQEAYPELKSNQNVQALMGELTGTENGISGVRDQYNDTVTNYNKSVQKFPKNVFASMFGYKERKQFKADSGADKAPKVKFTE